MKINDYNETSLFDEILLASKDSNGFIKYDFNKHETQDRIANKIIGGVTIGLALVWVGYKIGKFFHKKKRKLFVSNKRNILIEEKKYFSSSDGYCDVEYTVIE